MLLYEVHSNLLFRDSKQPPTTYSQTSPTLRQLKHLSGMVGVLPVLEKTEPADLRGLSGGWVGVGRQGQ